MPHSKDSYTPPGSDESLYRMMNSSSWMSRSFNVETTMLTEAMNNITQPLRDRQPNQSKIIRWEIIANLVLIGLALGVQFTDRSPVVRTSVELYPTSQYR